MNKTVKFHAPEHYESLAARFAGDSIVVTDTNGLFLWANEAFTRLSGYTIDEMVGKKPGSVLQGTATCKQTVNAVSNALQHRRPIEIDILNYAKTGQPYWVEMHITPIFDETGRQTHFTAVQRDISRRKEIEAETFEVIQREKMADAERKLFAMVSEWLYSTKSMDELFMVVRKSMETMFPESEGSLYVYSNSRDTLDLATSWAMENPPKRIPPDDCWALRRGRGYSYGTKAIEFTCAHIDDEETPYFCLPIVAHGETIGMLHLAFMLPGDGARDQMLDFVKRRWSTANLCAEQISLAIANVRLRQELLDQSVRDPLTNLWNRRWMVDAIRREINVAREHEAPLAVLSLDVDHFKKFNDAYGHDAGDLVLREVSREMSNTISVRGEACRAGGEEFAIICPALDADTAAALAEKVRAAVERLEVVYDDHRLPAVTASIGVAVYPNDGGSVTELLKSADIALYKAKDSGRNCVVSAREVKKQTKRK
ncbi:MAG: diguanylate cyclase [Paracoccaceae bacterium]|nr:diguanylate cyclase [Paracoccaceae bacterium]